MNEIAMTLVAFAFLAASTTVFIGYRWMAMVKSLRRVQAINREAEHTVAGILRMESVALGQAAWVEEKRTYLYELFNNHKDASESHDKSMSGFPNKAVARIGGVEKSPSFSASGAAYVNSKKHGKEQLAYV